MAAALECWPSRMSTDDDVVEQILMHTAERSELRSSMPTKQSSSAVHKKLQRLTRNVSDAIASLKNSMSLDSASSSNNTDGHRSQVWSGVVRRLSQLYPGSQLPEKLVSNVRDHYNSMPLSYALAGFEMKDVLVHIRLMEQASVEDKPVIMIQEVVSNDEEHDLVYKIIFACNCLISGAAISRGLESYSVCCKKVQMFERKGSTLGVLMIRARAEEEEEFKARIENALKVVLKKPKQSGMKLAFVLCGCQEENGGCRDFAEIEESFGGQDFRSETEHSNPKVQLPVPLPCSSFAVLVDEWQTIRSGGDEISKWLLDSESVEFFDRIGPNSFRGGYMGKKVVIEKLKGCDKGNAYEFKLRRDLLELMTCGHKNVLQFHGVCIDEIHGLCVVTRFMEGGTVHDLMIKSKKLKMKEIMRIVVDVAEGLKFINDHGVAYRDLNSHRLLLDRHGNACLGDLGVVRASKSTGEAMEYETDGYRWLAPEIIAGDPESVNETWMSNVYSFGMVMWEMVAGEAAYSALSPVQAAVGIAACGLRPEIPKDCPQLLKSLMIKCWSDRLSKRPQFDEILSTLLQSNVNRNNR